MSGEYLLWLFLISIPILDTAATLYFLRLFWASKDDGGRSWLAALIAITCGAITASFSIVGRIAWLRLTDEPVNSGATFWTLLAVIVLGFVPVLWVIVFWRQSK